MAGDWIKMRVDLRDDPAVFQIAERLGLDELHVIGGLFCFWSWADKHTVDGRVDGATSRLVDRVSCINGFSDALVSVGWLCLDDRGASIPNFERHNGETAKERAQKNARQARWRRNKGADVDGDVDGDASTRKSTNASTREEKRREQKKEKEAASNDAGASAPSDFLPANPTEQEAKAFIWKHGPVSLTAANTCTDKNARSMLGDALKKIGAEKTATIIESMVCEQPLEPVEYFQASLQRARFVS